MIPRSSHSCLGTQSPATGWWGRPSPSLPSSGASPDIVPQLPPGEADQWQRLDHPLTMYSKQRSYQRVTAFLVPPEGGFAARLGEYLGKINSKLHSFTSRLWWTGTTASQVLCDGKKHAWEGAAWCCSLPGAAQSEGSYIPLLQENICNNCCQRRYDKWANAGVLRLEKCCVSRIYFYQ